jgi:hypothetical protein
VLLNLPSDNFQPIHPLDDPRQELKKSFDAPMQMTLAVRISLLVLRFYLVFMGLLVLYDVLRVAHILH